MLEMVHVDRQTPLRMDRSRPEQLQGLLSGISPEELVLGFPSVLLVTGDAPETVFLPVCSFSGSFGAQMRSMPCLLF